VTSSKRRESFSTVIASGDLQRSLEATRDQIARDLEVCESMRDKAALYLRLSDVLQRLEDVKPEQVKAGDPVDEVAARRAARRAGTASTETRSQG